MKTSFLRFGIAALLALACAATAPLARAVNGVTFAPGTAGILFQDGSGNVSASSTIGAASLSGGTLYTLTVAGNGAITVTPGATVTLAAGTNVTLTQVANTVTIAATGGGGSGVTSVSVASGLLLLNPTTTASIGSPIFHAVTNSASPGLNTASLSIAAGATFTTSGSSVQINSSNSSSIITVSGSPTLSGSGTITYSALPFLAANQTFSGANTFSGTVTLSTVASTVSLTGQFDGTNGLRVQSTGSTSNVLTIKSFSQSAARTLTLSIDSSLTMTPSAIIYTNANATLGTVTASSFTTSGIATVGGVNTSGIINGGAITGSSLTTSGAVTAGSFTASGDMFAAGGQFSSDVNYLGSSYTYSAIPTTGIAIGAAFDNNNRLVEANQSDYLSFLGLSSRLVKNSIEPFHGGLDVVRKIDVTRYHYNASAHTGYAPDEWLYGPIAEDLNAVFPDAVSRTADPAKWSVRDRVLLALDTNAIKELDTRTTGLVTKSITLTVALFGALAAVFFAGWSHFSHRRTLRRLHAHLGLATK